MVNKISPTRIRNIILGNTFSDIKKRYEIHKKTSINKTIGNNIFRNCKKCTNNLFSKKEGIIFENKIYSEIRRNFPEDFIEIAGKNESFNPSFENIKEYHKKTERAIKNEIPIIIQAPLCSKHEKSTKNGKYLLFGVSDIIIRNDYLPKLIKNYDCDEKIDKSSYSIIEIKNKTFNFLKNGKRIGNNPLTNTYKVQTLIYSSILSEILKHQPKNAFLLGNSYVSYKNKNDVNGPLENIVSVNFEKEINIHEIMIESINTSLFIDNNIDKLGEEPHNHGFLPNIKYEREFGFNKDLTKIWRVTDEMRKNAVGNGKYFDYTHNQATISNLSNNRGITDYTKYSEKMLSINDILLMNQTSKYRCIFKKSFYEKIMKIKNGATQLFVDFETSNNIYLIGVGRYSEMEEREKKRKRNNKNGRWTYKTFIANSLDDESERIMVKDFEKYVNRIKKYSSVTFFHWGRAEIYWLEKYNKKHERGKFPINGNEWIDLCDMMISNSVVIRGMINFKLKTVANAMVENKLIDMELWNDDFDNGYLVCQMANSYYENKKLKNKINKIKDYNELDCRTLFEILNYFSNNVNKIGRIR